MVGPLMFVSLELSCFNCHLFTFRFASVQFCSKNLVIGGVNTRDAVSEYFN